MGRLDLIKEDPFYLKCLLLNGDRERDRLFCRHDYTHMYLVAELICKIMEYAGNNCDFIKSEGLGGCGEAREIQFAAGLLHDIGRWLQYDSGEDHALAGSKMAVPVLVRARFTEKEIKIVTRAIREHRRATPGQSLLGRVVSLADDLSRPCGTCKARLDCYKYEYMESIREKNLHGYVLAGG